MSDIDRALSHVKRAQENRKRRDMESLKTNLDSAERLLEGSLDPIERDDTGENINRGQ